jgi:hypothetical protein
LLRLLKILVIRQTTSLNTPPPTAAITPIRIATNSDVPNSKALYVPATAKSAP